MATIPIKRSTSTILSPLIDDSSRLTRVLNGDDYITLSFTHDSFVEILVDDYITWDGIDYYIKQTPDLRKISEREYRYDLRFDGPQGNLVEALFLLDGEGEFYLTGIAEDFVDLIVVNLNRVYGAATYVTGTVTGTDFKNLYFKNEDCLTVLRRLCEEFELEYYFSSGVGIEINLITEIGNATLLAFEYHDGLYNIKRSKVSEKDLITRLYAFGSEKNIDYNYGAKRLRLPALTYPSGYVEQNTGTYGVREAVHEWDDIYPHYEGSVTSTPSETEVIDTLIDFDLNSYLIEGVAAKIVFRTGDLAGYEFEIISFDNVTKKTTFKTYTDETGLTLPNTLIKPAIGDEFTFVDITTPTAYITAAESALETAATALLAERSSPNVQYEIDMDWHDLQGTDTTLDVGDIITITDPELAIGGVNFRILELTQSIANKYKYTVKVGESLLIGYLKRTINERKRIKHEVVITRDLSVIDIRRGYQMIDELQDLIFDQDGYFDPDNIKPLSIETLMLAVGAKSTQLTLNGVLAQPNYQGNENYLNISTGDLIHFTIAATVKTWNIASYNSTSLVSGTAYYMYVKCDKATTSATWLVTDVQYEVDPDDGYYYFLVGFLSSVISDLRRLSWLYGQTTINGGFITAGRIQDLSGNIYFDLETGVVETTKAGISANDTGDSAVRIWAGDTYANRNTAPFRVTENGAVIATNATIQSSDTGQRVVLDGTNNRLEFFDSAHANYVIRMDDNLFGGCAGIYMHDGTGTTYSYISGNGMHFKGQFTDTSSTGFITHTNSGTQEQSAFGVLAQATNPALTARFFGIQVMVSTYYGAAPSDGYGIQSYIASPGANTYGLHSAATGGTNTYGVYGTATGGTNRYGGYFTASAGGTIVRALYTSGAVQLANLPSKSSETYVIWSDASGNLALGTAPAGGSSPLTTKGDIYTYSTADARLPVGTNGQILSADSTETTGLKWTAPGGSGDVIKDGTSVADRFASWSGTGYLLKDSGYSASSFATASHNHDAYYISIITTPTSGNFPTITAGGELVNSIYNYISFATAGHTHSTLSQLANGGLATFSYNGGSAVTVGLNFTNLTNETVLASTDEFAYYDASATAMRALTYTALLAELNSDLSFGSGDGDVVKSGSSANNRLAAWTGTGNTIRAESNLTFATNTLAIGSASTESVISLGASGSSYDWFIRHTSGGAFEIKYYNDIKFSLSTTILTLPVVLNVDTINEYTTDAGVTIETVNIENGWVSIPIDKGLRCDPGDTNILQIQAYNISGASWTTMIGVASGNTASLWINGTSAQMLYLPVDDTETYLVAVDPTTGVLSRRAVSSLSAGGTVTSVALSMPTAIFDVAGSPITTSGTFTVTLDSQAPNNIFAGPAVGGSPAAPTFRALVGADIPSHTHVKADITDYDSHTDVVTKSGSSVAGRFASWVTTGWDIEDSGYSASSFATASHHHWGTATNTYVVLGSSTGSIQSASHLNYNLTTRVLSVLASGNTTDASVWIMGDVGYNAYVMFTEYYGNSGIIGYDGTANAVKFEYGSTFTSSPAIFIGSNNHVCIGGTTNDSTYELYVTGDQYTTGGSTIIGKLYVNTNIVDYATVIYNDASGGKGLQVQTNSDTTVISFLVEDYYNLGDLFKITSDGLIYMPAISSATGNYYLKWSTSGLVTYSATSDIRLKENIRCWDFDSLNFLVNLDLKKFDWKDGSWKDEIGWIAQDIEGYFPEMIGYDKDGFLLIKEPYFLNHFHRAIKQHYAITESHEQKIKRLEKRVSELENQFNIN